MAYPILSLWLLVAQLGPCAYGQNAPAQESHSTPGKEPGSSTFLDNSDFTFNLYRELVAPDPSRNLLFSPLSISFPLTLLAFQAKPEAREDILNYLGFRVTGVPEEDSDSVYERYSQLLEASLPAPGECQADTGSVLFLGQKRDPVRKFARRAQDLYRTEVFPTFFKNLHVAPYYMSKVMERKTHNKIRNFFKGANVHAVLILANYMFFKGKWKYQFDPAATEIMPFSVSKEQTVLVPMMQRLGWFQQQYFRPLHIEVLQMPCTCNTTAIFIVPTRGTLAKVEEALTKQNFDLWTQPTKPSKGILYFPKLSLTGNVHLDKLVLPPNSLDVFSYNTGLSRISLPNMPLRLSRIVHRVELTMDEEGTEEEDVAKLKRLPNRQIPDIRFDKPFLLVVFKEDSRNILFIGKVTNPKAS